MKAADLNCSIIGAKRLRQRRNMMKGKFILPAIIFALSSGAFALDMILLKDGEVVQGRILSESDTHVMVEIANYNRTIFSTRPLARSEINKIQRESVEEKQKREMEEAYTDIKKDRLGESSYALPYYDQVIENVLQAFLKKYPASPHADEILANLKNWEEERDRVRGGEIKYHGQWFKGEDGVRAVAAARAEQVLTEAEALLARESYPIVVSKLKTFITSKPPEVNSLRSAVEMLERTYGRWLHALQKQEEQIKANVKTARADQSSAEQVVSAAQSKFDEARSRANWGDTRLGVQAGVQLAKNELDNAQSRLRSYQRAVNEWCTSQSAIQQKIRDVALEQTEMLRQARSAVQVLQQELDRKAALLRAEEDRQRSDEARQRAEEERRRAEEEERRRPKPTWGDKYWGWVAGGMGLAVLWYLVARIDAWRS